MDMPEKVSRTRLKRSYERLLKTLPETIIPGFSLEEYRGKHCDGRWVKYSFVCESCGTRFQRVLQGKITCPTCTVFTRPGRQTKWDDILSKFREIHGIRYRYPAQRPDDFRGHRTLIEIECPKHGTFTQRVRNHINGNGCPDCSGGSTKKLTTEEFISRATQNHGDRYDYSLVEYKNNRTPVVVVCQKHGQFHQVPEVHLRKDVIGCPGCAGYGSKSQREIADFLRALDSDVELIENTRDVIKPYELDIYLPEKSLAIEYCGLYWHSEANGIQSNYHLMKHRMCEEKGIRLITIFEDEWRDQRDIVESFFVHLFGKSEKGCFARNASIREITWAQSRDFLREHHLLGEGSRAIKYKIGAFDEDDELIAVMLFGNPSDERGKKDVVEMKRFVTDKRNHPGLGSRMFTWAVREYGFDTVVAFVDKRWFCGEFKLISGFVVDGDIRPTPYWTDFTKRYKRRFMTKKQLMERDEFKGRNMTKRDMMVEIGFSRIWDCGKFRFVWHRSD